MNQAKRLIRLKALLFRLNNNQEVSNRDLKLVLSDAEFQDMQNNWEAVKSQKNLDKPKEVKHYEKLLKRATLFNSRYESYYQKSNAKSGIQIDLSYKVEYSLDKAAEYFHEITNEGFLRIWFDRDIDKDGSLALENMPRAITSKSHFGENGVAFNTTKIRDIKITAVEEAMEQIENPSNTNQANDGLEEAMTTINSFKSRKRNYNF